MEMAGQSILSRAMLSKALEMRSPDDNRRSISRSLPLGLICLAIANSLSVSPAIAETTTIISTPVFRIRATRSATFLIRSMLPTEVPPYFCTTSSFISLIYIKKHFH